MEVAGWLPFGNLRQDTLTGTTQMEGTVKYGEVQHSVVLRHCDRLQLADVWGRRQENKVHRELQEDNTHVAFVNF